jgi:hypothetical protein
MGQAELEELLRALNLNKAAMAPTDSNIFYLGDKLSVTHLIFSRLAAAPQPSPDYGFQLALYDIRARKKLRDRPASSPDFRKLLQSEDKFFSTLHGGDIAEADTRKGREWFRGSRAPWKIGISSLSLVAGGTLAYLAIRSARDADEEFDLAQNAQNREAAISHRERTQSLDTKTQVFGALGAMGLGVSLTLLVF